MKLRAPSRVPGDSRFSRRVAAGLLILLFWLAAGMAAWGEKELLPASHWNRTNLTRIKAPKADPLTFAVFGDSRNSRVVFPQLLRQVDGDPDLALAIHLGDLVHDGALEEYRFFLDQVRQNLRLPLLTVIGNHEVHKQGRKLYREIFGPFYYSFNLGDHFFIALDTADKTGPDEEQVRWLEAQLQQAQAYKTRLVFMHVPLFDARGTDYHHCLPRESGRRLAAIFQKYRVTHAFAAHLHSHYTGNWGGVPYTISGGAGAQLGGADPAHDFFHYLKVTVHGTRVRVKVQRVMATEGRRRPAGQARWAAP